jgi:hypothetical protein
VWCCVVYFVVLMELCSYGQIDLGVAKDENEAGYYSGKSSISYHMHSGIFQCVYVEPDNLLIVCMWD